MSPHGLRHHAPAIGAALLLVVSVACAPRPRLAKPVAVVPAEYKEIGNWQPAQPDDAAIRGKWWEVFQDLPLNALEDQLAVSSETLKAAQAQFAQARAFVRSARAGLFPQVNGSTSTLQADQSANKPYWNGGDTRYSDYLLHADVSYEIDVWGRVAHTVEAGRANAQATAADLESVGLSLRAELALDYFQLRSTDVEKQILDTTVANYAKALDLTRNREQGGVATVADVAQAETQLQSTLAQAIDVNVRRAQFEHAIAVLVGQPASTFTIPAAAATPIVPPPAIPAGVPAHVLERRPDVAGAERRMAAASAQVGVASSAFFPLLNLTGAFGFESGGLTNWVKTVSTFWTAAPTAAIALLDGGRRRAATDQAIAGYERTEAVYHDTLLTAFREVEDNLAALRILAEEATVQDAAVAAAERSLAQATNRYTGGVATYLEVISAQNALLTNQRTSINIQLRRLTASVLLIKALGGGWDAKALASTP
jgi:NodT family efflux transporter outer membrane factor (OMF) lipoprotein